MASAVALNHTIILLSSLFRSFAIFFSFLLLILRLLARL